MTRALKLPPTRAELRARRKQRQAASLVQGSKLVSVEAVYKRGPHAPFDTLLAKIAGRPNAGSGYNFGTGERDVEFVFAKRAAAIRAAKRLRFVPGVLRVKVSR